MMLIFRDMPEYNSESVSGRIMHYPVTSGLPNFQLKSGKFGLRIRQFLTIIQLQDGHNQTFNHYYSMPSMARSFDLLNGFVPCPSFSRRPVQ